MFSSMSYSEETNHQPPFEGARSALETLEGSSNYSKPSNPFLLVARPESKSDITSKALKPKRNSNNTTTSWSSSWSRPWSFSWSSYLRGRGGSDTSATTSPSVSVNLDDTFKSADDSDHHPREQWGPPVPTSNRFSTASTFYSDSTDQQSPHGVEHFKKADAIHSPVEAATQTGNFQGVVDVHQGIVLEDGWSQEVWHRIMNPETYMEVRACCRKYSHLVLVADII